MRLKDKVAIVAGGASGIGRATCQLFAREGARIVVADIAIEEANKVADGIKALGGEAIALKVDVRRLEDAEKMLKTALDKFGHVDILANVAGGSAGPLIQSERGPFAKSSKERWDNMIDLNLCGVLNCTQAVINHMIERRTGKIINIASGSGMLGERNAAVYSAAKGGIIAFTKALAKEVGPSGITVNCVSPGICGSERVLSMLSKEGIEEAAKGIYLGRLGTPDDLANALLFLASNEANYITGHNLMVDGGLTLGPE